LIGDGDGFAWIFMFPFSIAPLLELLGAVGCDVGGGLPLGGGGGFDVCGEKSILISGSDTVFAITCDVAGRLAVILLSVDIQAGKLFTARFPGACAVVVLAIVCAWFIGSVVIILFVEVILVGTIGCCNASGFGLVVVVAAATGCR
jgi:hypothetical protein